MSRIWLIQGDHAQSWLAITARGRILATSSTRTQLRRWAVSRSHAVAVTAPPEFAAVLARTRARAEGRKARGARHGLPAAGLEAQPPGPGGATAG